MTTRIYGHLCLLQIPSDYKGIKHDHWTIGLVVIISIPIPHVVVVLSHRPLLHLRPFVKAIRAKDLPHHLYPGFATTPFHSKGLHESRDDRVGELSISRLWNSKRRGGKTI